LLKYGIIDVHRLLVAERLSFEVERLQFADKTAKMGEKGSSTHDYCCLLAINIKWQQEGLRNLPAARKSALYM
jgi:hypothetical protein